MKTFPQFLPSPAGLVSVRRGLDHFRPGWGVFISVIILLVLSGFARGQATFNTGNIKLTNCPVQVNPAQTGFFLCFNNNVGQVASPTVMWRSIVATNDVDSTDLVDGTTIGRGLFTLPNPSAITFLRINANNTPSTRTAVELKTDLTLQNVDNTSDANKPVSTATQTALNLKLDAANPVMSGVMATNAAAPTIASAGTIAPVTRIVFISGVVQVNTITPPSPISAGGGQITLIPTGTFTTGTSGNIALASTAVVSKALIMTYDSGTAKWYPSY